MGANNSGREIAAERLVFEKEKLSGLRPLSYVASKAAFLTVTEGSCLDWLVLLLASLNTRSNSASSASNARRSHSTCNSFQLNRERRQLLERTLTPAPG